MKANGSARGISQNRRVSHFRGVSLEGNKWRVRIRIDAALVANAAAILVAPNHAFACVAR